jgi:hypothetical protein
LNISRQHNTHQKENFNPLIKQTNQGGFIMKQIRMNSKIFLVVLLVGLFLIIFGCEKQNILEPAATLSSSGLKDASFYKGPSKDNSPDNQGEDYPQSASRDLTYNSNQTSYNGGNINIPGGSTFSVLNGSLIPPEGTQSGKTVTITMLAEKVKYKGKSQLVFTFGPHGSQFTTPAEVIFDWTDLGINQAHLFYIDESGNYIPQNPESLDINNKRMTMKIDHFSRYAIGEMP